MSDEEKCRSMLSRIASCVSDFCNEEETALQGVAKLAALYYDTKASEAWDYVERLKKEETE